MPNEESSPQLAPLTYRRAVPADRVAEIDDSFTTDAVFDVQATPGGFTIEERAVSPFIKRFPSAESDPAVVRFVAVDAAELVIGYIDVEFQDWNRRLIIRQLAVTPALRGRGIGRSLLGLAVEHGRECRARTLWLEVTNVNAPAIGFYRRMGFTCCGLDMSLYRDTPAEGEIALFMSQDL